jgi:transcriptional regulator with XRE-family HTH domain
MEVCFLKSVHAHCAQMKFSNTKEFYLAAGARIREARGKSITQEQLAKAAGLSRVSVVNIEAGRQKLLLHHAIVMADVLGVSLAELIDPLLPKPGEKPDLSDAGDAEGFVRAALKNLSLRSDSKIAQ